MNQSQIQYEIDKARRALGFEVAKARKEGRNPSTYEWMTIGGRRYKIEAIDVQPQYAGYATKENTAFLPVFEDSRLTGQIFEFAYGQVGPEPLVQSDIEMFRQKRERESTLRKEWESSQRLEEVRQKYKNKPPSPPKTLTKQGKKEKELKKKALRRL